MSVEKILFLVILYKRKCENSETLNTLIPQVGDHFIYIWDNSPLEDVQRNDYLTTNRCSYEYFHCPENNSLSTVYQNLIYKSISMGFNHLVILDQDSNLDNNFVSGLSENISASPESVLVPKVLVGDLLVSPGYSWKWFGWELKPSKKIKLSRISAINSGLCIPTKKFVDTNFSFPLGIKNYGTDVYFFEHIRVQCIKVGITKAYIQHDLTFHKSNTDNNSYLNSYVEHMSAMRIIFSIGPISFVCFNLYVLLHGVKMSLMRKDKRFLTWWIHG